MNICTQSKICNETETLIIYPITLVPIRRTLPNRSNRRSQDFARGGGAETFEDDLRRLHTAPLTKYIIKPMYTAPPPAYATGDGEYS